MRKRTGTGAWVLALLVVGLYATLAVGADGPVSGTANQSVSSSSAATLAIRRALQAALQKAQQPDAASQSDAALREVIDSPVFNTLDTSEQHLALAAAAGVALQLDQPQRAQQLVTRATDLPEQSIDDWRLRLVAATRVGDARDQVNCVATIAHRWGRALSEVSDQLILRAASDAQKAGLEDERLGMLVLLYEIRWKPSSGREPGALWRELSLLQLNKNQLDQAMDVASHITDPYDVIVMRADNRYKPLFKSEFVPHDVRKVAEDSLQQSRAAMEAAPHSLSRVVHLASALIRLRRDREALSLTDDVIRQVEPASLPHVINGGVSPYTDLDSQYAWLLGVRAEALADLGRFDEAVTTQQRSIQWPGNKDLISHHINLAEVLCEFDRPQEALAVLPQPDKASPYGRMQIELNRLTAAVEEGDVAEADGALDYLRQHQADSHRTLQRALVIAGRVDEGAALLLARLSDSVLRAEALADVQDYLEPSAPPRVLQWREQFKKLRERRDIRAAIDRVGRIDRYPVNYAPF